MRLTKETRDCEAPKRKLPLRRTPLATPFTRRFPGAQACCASAQVFISSVTLETVFGVYKLVQERCRTGCNQWTSGHEGDPSAQPGLPRGRHDLYLQHACGLVLRPALPGGHNNG